MDFKFEDLLPMEPTMGPPLPKFLAIFWPWYKAVPTQGTLSVTSVPTGATVLLNPAPGASPNVGVTPLNIPLDPGAYTLTLTLSGYQDFTRAVNITAGQTTTVTATLTATLAQTCPYCGEQFNTLDELIAHIATAHPDKPPLLKGNIVWT